MVACCAAGVSGGKNFCINLLSSGCADATMWPNPKGVIGVTAGLIGGLALLAAMIATMPRRELA